MGLRVRVPRPNPGARPKLRLCREPGPYSGVGPVVASRPWTRPRCMEGRGPTFPYPAEEKIIRCRGSGQPYTRPWPGKTHFGAALASLLLRVCFAFASRVFRPCCAPAPGIASGLLRSGRVRERDRHRVVRNSIPEGLASYWRRPPGKPEPCRSAPVSGCRRPPARRWLAVYPPGRALHWKKYAHIPEHLAPCAGPWPTGKDSGVARVAARLRLICASFAGLLRVCCAYLRVCCGWCCPPPFPGPAGRPLLGPQYSAVQSPS